MFTISKGLWYSAAWEQWQQISCCKTVSVLMCETEEIRFARNLNEVYNTQRCQMEILHPGDAPGMSQRCSSLGGRQQGSSRGGSHSLPQPKVPVWDGQEWVKAACLLQPPPSVLSSAREGRTLCIGNVGNKPLNKNKTYCDLLPGFPVSAPARSFLYWYVWFSKLEARLEGDFPFLVNTGKPPFVFILFCFFTHPSSWRIWFGN